MIWGVSLFLETPIFWIPPFVPSLGSIAKVIPSWERFVHIPPKGRIKIIESKVPLGGDMLFHVISREGTHSEKRQDISCLQHETLNSEKVFFDDVVMTRQRLEIVWWCNAAYALHQKLAPQLQFRSLYLGIDWYIQRYSREHMRWKVGDASPTGKMVVQPWFFRRKRYVSREKVLLWIIVGNCMITPPCFVRILTIFGICMTILPCSIGILMNFYGITGMGLPCFSFRGTSKACSRTGSKQWSSLSASVLWRPHRWSCLGPIRWSDGGKFQWRSWRWCRILAIHGYCSILTLL